MLRVCPAWQAVVLASPELMPATAVLSAPPLEVAAIDRDIRYWRFAMSQARDTANAKLLLDKVAAVDPLAWHVRLQVVDDQVRCALHTSASRCTAAGSGVGMSGAGWR